MDAALKLSRQYWVEQKQPQRVNYISRELSYHGNTLGTLQISGHVTRRAPYNAVLNQTNFHKVSPAYAKRFQKADENDERQESPCRDGVHALPCNHCVSTVMHTEITQYVPVKVCCELTLGNCVNNKPVVAS